MTLTRNAGFRDYVPEMKSAVFDPKALGEAIVRRRRKARLRQRELARRAGIHPSLMCKYERGKTRIGNANLKRVCEVLGCLPKDLLADGWQISEFEGSSGGPAPGADSVTLFPQAELERIYDESISDRKKLYLETCRVLFEALRRLPRAG